VQSDGTTPLTSSFVLEIGTFVDFTPTPENTAEWQTHWRALSSTPYNEETSLFSGSTKLETNASPFTTESRVFLWGYDRLKTNAQWLLISKPTWRWPDANAGGPGPNPGGGGLATFTLNQAEPSDAIFPNSIKTNGIQIRMTDVSIPTSYAEWVLEVFTEAERADTNLITQSSDPDQDGRSNLVEYAIGSNPNERDFDPFVSIEEEAELIALRVKKAEFSQVEVTPKISLNLQDGFPLSLPTSAGVIQETGEMVFRFPKESSRFFRVEITE